MEEARHFRSQLARFAPEIAVRTLLKSSGRLDPTYAVFAAASKGDADFEGYVRSRAADVYATRASKDCRRTDRRQQWCSYASA